MLLGTLIPLLAVADTLVVGFNFSYIALLVQFYFVSYLCGIHEDTHFYTLVFVLCTRIHIYTLWSLGYTQGYTFFLFKARHFEGEERESSPGASNHE